MLKKNLHFGLFGLLLFLTSLDSFCQSWEQIQNFPGTPRDDGSVFVIGNKAYCGLGLDNGFNCTGDFHVFDGSTLNWSLSQPLPIGEERQYANSCSWNGKGYIFGGIACGGSYLNDVWVFDPLTSIWTSGPVLPDLGRAGAVDFIIDDTLYIVGGKNLSGIISEVWALDLTNNSWTQKNTYPGNGIWRGLSFSRNGMAYAGLGKNNLNSQTEFNTTIFSYDPSFDNWTVMPDVGLSPRCYLASAMKDSLVLIFGGVDQSNTILNSFHRLDVDAWTLTSLTDFPSSARKGVMSFLLNDLFYIATGVSQTARLNETWRIGQILAIDNELNNQVLVYPNPCSKKCTIEFGMVNSDVLILYSLDGRVVEKYDIKGQVSIEIDADELESGTYIIRVGEFNMRLEIIK